MSTYPSFTPFKIKPLYPCYSKLNKHKRDFTCPFHRAAYLWLTRAYEVKAACLFYEDVIGKSPPFVKGDALAACNDDDVDAAIEALKMAADLKKHKMNPRNFWSPSRVYHEIQQMEKAYAKANNL